MKEKYVVMEDGVIEFYIIKKNKGNGINKYTLKRSNAEHWDKNCRGEKIISLIDTDGQISIKEYGNNKVIVYHELIELGILISFIEDQDPNKAKREISKVIKLDK